MSPQSQGDQEIGGQEMRQLETGTWSQYLKTENTQVTIITFYSFTAVTCVAMSHRIFTGKNGSSITLYNSL